jgi:hypothetical protein
MNNNNNMNNANNINNIPLDKIYQKVSENRKDLIKNNPLKKSAIIDLEENQLNKVLEKRNNSNYLKEREKKKYLEPKNDLKYTLVLNNTEILLCYKEINNINTIKFINKKSGSINLLIQFFKNSKNIVFLEKIYFRIYDNDKLLYELKLNNYGIKESEITQNNYKENTIQHEYIIIGKYNINNNNYNINPNKNFEIILEKINNNYYLKSLIFLNKEIINKIKELNNIK